MSKKWDVQRLTRKELRILAANHRKWQRKLQSHYHAIEASTQITAADLAVRVGPCREGR